MKPTVGRVLWYWSHSARDTDCKYRAAIVCRVWNDHLVNLMVINWKAVLSLRGNVELLEEGAEHPTTHGFATWPDHDRGMLVEGSAELKTFPDEGDLDKIEEAVKDII